MKLKWFRMIEDVSGALFRWLLKQNVMNLNWVFSSPSDPSEGRENIQEVERFKHGNANKGHIPP